MITWKLCLIVLWHLLGSSISFELRIIDGSRPRQIPPYVIRFETFSNGEPVGRGSGVAITQGHILTAANRIHGFEMWRVEFNSKPNEVMRSNVTTSAIHPQFDPVTLINDIGILFFTSSLRETIALPSNTELPFSSQRGIIDSNGATSVEPFIFPSSSHVHRANNTVLDEYYCRSLLMDRADLKTMTHFCAIDQEKSSRVCVGDEGAGFISEIDGIKTVTGIVSFSTNMCNPKFPAVFTRVGLYLDWINSVI